MLCRQSMQGVYTRRKRVKVLTRHRSRQASELFADRVTVMRLEWFLGDMQVFWTFHLLLAKT